MNRKLQELCLRVGLVEDNTLYSFRRAAASQTIDQHGVAAAQELPSHHPVDKAPILYYDPIGMGRTDMTAFRLGGETLSKAEIAFFFFGNQIWLCTKAKSVRWRRRLENVPARESEKPRSTLSSRSNYKISLRRSTKLYARLARLTPTKTPAFVVTLYSSTLSG
jgi:hypothetical protein